MRGQNSTTVANHIKDRRLNSGAIGTMEAGKAVPLVAKKVREAVTDTIEDPKADYLILLRRCYRSKGGMPYDIKKAIKNSFFIFPIY